MRNLGAALFAGLVGLAILVAASDVTGKWELDVAFDDARSLVEAAILPV
jgi:hypothetical protein